MGTWHTLDHTADLAIEAWGGTPERALEALCEGLLHQITDPARVGEREGVGLAVEGFDPAEALVGFLNELLYRVNVRGWMPARVEVTSARGSVFRGAARGEPRDPARHAFDLEVKAATYHDLLWGPDPKTGEWRVRVVFDV